MKKLLTTIALGAGLMLSSTPALAAQPAPININFNGHTLTSDVDPVIQNSRTLVPVRAISESLGADVEWDGSTRTITITKNDKTITLVADKKATQINGQPSTDLDVPATIVNQRTMVPVRFINEALGATVDWDNATRTVVINYEEKRDGMTPAEVLAKSNVEMAKKDTYQFNGSFEMNVQVQDKAKKESPQDITTTMTLDGGMKQSTNQANFNMGINAYGQDLATSYYFDGTNAYMKGFVSPDWQKIPMAIDPNLLDQWKVQDTAEALKFMDEFGFITAFGNDETIDGQDYYVLRVSLDQKKFMENLGNLMGSFTGGLTPADQAEFNQVMNNMKMLISVKVYIDKATFLMHSEEMDATVYVNDENVAVKENIKGVFNVTDLGKTVTFPTIPADVQNMELPTVSQPAA